MVKTAITTTWGNVEGRPVSRPEPHCLSYDKQLKLKQILDTLHYEFDQEFRRYIRINYHLKVFLSSPRKKSTLSRHHEKKVR
jgi:hypothetical protein